MWRKWCGVRWVVLAAVAVIAAGCGSDLYEACTFDANSSNPRERECSTTGAFDNCVVELHSECSDACAVIAGAGPYCTNLCEDDGDCDDGTCQVILSNPSRSYCVRN